MAKDKNRVCPVELAPSMDTRIRRLIQNPDKILSRYIQEGMTVLDIGCGPGYFSTEIAKLVGIKGKVIAADLQEGMLQIVRDKITGTELEKIIQTVKCSTTGINVSEKVDFILAFYMVHEVPDKNSLFMELKNILNAEGKILLVEPKLFHLSKSEFLNTVMIAKKNGFKASPAPMVLFSWSVILEHATV
jgi:ubiquinone/menaquinone biosynthesis C-methylase UbiE